jgi:ABC-type uncharacterized transport system permease subunit
MTGLEKQMQAHDTLPWADRWVRAAGAGRRLQYSLLAVLLAFGVAAFFIMLSGKNPLLAYRVMARGAFGSVDAISFALNKSAPYILAGVGVALCFRARIINIGGEGQIAVGGICTTWAALHCGAAPDA